MRVLIACEYTGTERDAFIAAGHDAMSCDLLPTETPGPHYRGDVRDGLSPKERSRIHYMSPGADRGKLRSAAYPGIAAAMADQWGRVDGRSAA